MNAFDVLKGLTTRKRDTSETSNSTLSLISGCVLRKDQNKFHKTILRLSRGNAAVQFKDMNNLKFEEQLIFVVLLVGQEGGILQGRCKKSISSFERSRIFDIPEYEEEQIRVQQEKQQEIQYKKMLYNKSINMILVELRECSGVTN